MLEYSRGWNNQGIFVSFNKLERGGRGGHNKITLGEDRKSILKKVGRGHVMKIKWKGGYLSLYINP